MKRVSRLLKANPLDPMSGVEAKLLPVIAVFSCRPESGKVLLFFCS